MGRVPRILFCLTGFLSTMAAQEAAAAAKLPPAMQAAIERIAKGGGKAETPPNSRVVRAEAIAQGACSVPLLEMRIEDTEKFTIRRFQSEATERMSRLTVPAPPCER
jgi:hypothetical protein